MEARRTGNGHGSGGASVRLTPLVGRALVSDEAFGSEHWNSDGDVIAVASVRLGSAGDEQLGERAAVVARLAFACVETARERWRAAEPASAEGDVAARDETARRCRWQCSRVHSPRAGVTVFEFDVAGFTAVVALDKLPAVSFRIRAAHARHGADAAGGARRASMGVFPEVRVDMPSAGHWYGTGHMMQQHWPASAACLELGPFYPFDNGVCGLGTMAIAGWCTTSGLALLVDERRSPYLHIGVNAPIATASAGCAPRARAMRPRRTQWRRWTVGHENFARGTLPWPDARFAAGGEGDGGASALESLPVGDDLLRVQSRPGFDYEPAWHPLLGARLEHRDDDNDDDDNDVAAADDDGGGGGRSDAERLVRFWVGAARSDGGAVAGDVKSARHLLMHFMSLASSHGRAGDRQSAVVPRTPPPLALLTRPTWTTWARFKQHVTQRDVIAFAEEIAARHCLLPRDGGVMEIDDRWCRAYGDFAFDAHKFPDPRAMVRRLHELGFLVTLWCVAFVERAAAVADDGGADADADNGRRACEAYEQGRQRGYLVRDGATFPWWQPDHPVAALDMTHAEACAWFVRRVRALMAHTGVDGIKFDSGEPCWLPHYGGDGDGGDSGRDFERGTRALRYPNEYTDRWLNRVVRPIVSGADARATAPLSPCEARAATSTGACQSIPCLWRMFDRFSHFGYDNGLASVLPTMLVSGVLGFAFVLPDMIGGNEYGNDLAHAELMVRWVQATALMVSVQFSLCPWQFEKRFNLVDAMTAADSADHDDCDNTGGGGGGGDGGGCRHRRHHYYVTAESVTYDALQLRDRLLVRSGVLERCALDACRMPHRERGAEHDTYPPPIARPMWWAAPHNADAHAIADQFMIGDDLVVAPVVHAGCASRDVWLPPGDWRQDAAATRLGCRPHCNDNNRDKDDDSMHAELRPSDEAVHRGPCWLRRVPAPIACLPVFARVRP